MRFRQIKQRQSKINKHDSENLILSKYYLHGASQIKNVLKESVVWCITDKKRFKRISFRHGIWVVVN